MLHRTISQKVKGKRESLFTKFIFAANIWTCLLTLSCKFCIIFHILQLIPPTEAVERRCSVKKIIPKIFEKCAGKHPLWSLIIVKLPVLSLKLYWIRNTFFHEYFANFFKNLLSEIYVYGCFWYFHYVFVPLSSFSNWIR